MQSARVVAITGVLSFVTAVGVAEDAPQLAPGTRVRVKVSTEQKRMVGKLLALDERNFSLQVGDEMEPRILPREQIIDLAVSAGRRSRGRRLLYGAGIGAVLGAAIGYAAYEDPSEDEWAILTEPEHLAGVAAFYLGAAGALVGLVAIPGERWKDVPLESVQVSFRPVRGRGAGVFLTISF